MDIYVRHVNRGEAQFLTEGTLAEAHEIMSDMRKVGVVVDSLDRTREINGQYIVDDESAYFEIYVGEDE